MLYVMILDLVKISRLFVLSSFTVGTGALEVRRVDVDTHSILLETGLCVAGEGRKLAHSTAISIHTLTPVRVL